MPADPTITVVAPAPAGLDEDIAALVARARAAAGRRPIDEHRWGQAIRGCDRSQRSVIARTGDGEVGLALVTADGGAWSVDLVVDPDRRADRDVVEPLVRRVAATIADHGGGDTQLWVHEAVDADAAAAAAVGLADRRDLHQLRVPLPLDGPEATIATRPFVVDQDETAWLAVNAAAFADHPDQGQWTLDDLLARQAEPWFDPAGFLLHEVGGGDDARLAGFNWTKIHPPENGERPLGEIYVVAVHPDFAGRGLGRELCVAGLAHLSRYASTGMLYVDASNTPAMRLYLDLGFHVDHTNTAFAGRIAAS